MKRKAAPQSRIFATVVALAVSSAVVQDVTAATTDPVGFMTFPIPQGTTSAPSTALLYLPLQDVAVREGAMTGIVGTIPTATSVQVANAGWTPGQLAIPEFPMFLHVLSGANEGALYQISANTGDTLTIAGDLTGSGIASGDWYEVIVADTLNNLFGNTLIGGTSAAVADNIVTLSGAAYLTYYYNTERNSWERSAGPTTSRNNIVIRPEAGFYIVRRGPAFDLSLTGRVPISGARIPVANAGSTLMNYGFPVDITLGRLALQTAIPGWVSNPDPALADHLSIFSAGAYLTYFFNGSNWQRTAGPTTNRNSMVISAGTPFTVVKKGSAPGFSYYTKVKPY